MRPAAPAGFVSDCSLSEEHPGRVVPPRAILQTLSSVVREKGGVSSFFPPRLLLPSAATLTKELRAFSSFSTQMRQVQEKLLAAHAFVRTQQIQRQSTSSSDDPSSSSSLNAQELLGSLPAGLLSHDEAEAVLSNFGYFEETPLVVINAPTTAEVKKFGSSADNHISSSSKSSIQNQRSDFAKLLEESLNNNNSNKIKKGQESSQQQENSSSSSSLLSSLIPSFPEVSLMIGIQSELRKKAAEAFVERCKQLWQMFQALNNPNNTEIPDHVAKQLAGAGGSSRVHQLLKQPLVFSLQVALCAQDIACAPYVGFSWDLLGGGTIKETSNFSSSSSSSSSAMRNRIQLRDVFASEEEARKQVEISVLIHKILVAICNPPSTASPSSSSTENIDIRVEPSDLAILAYFALPQHCDGGDGTRLLELWPNGPLALFPIACFATFVPIKDAANAKIEMCANPRQEDGDDPILRIRSSSLVDANVLLQQQLELVGNNDDVNKDNGNETLHHQPLRIWKRPISNTVPENVVAAKEQAKQKDPRMAIARFMQNVMKPTSAASSSSNTSEEQNEKRKAALEMAMRLAGK